MTNIDPVRLPLMGEGVQEATIIKWLKNIGDPVSVDEPILEVSTDKVDTEIPSNSKGYLIAQFQQEGAVIEVDQIIGYVGQKPDQAAPPPPSNHSPKNSSKQTGKPNSKQEKSTANAFDNQSLSLHNLKSLAGPIRSSPLVQKLAKKHGINLQLVEGSGLYGRITKQDIVNFIQQNKKVHKEVNTETPAKLNIVQRDGTEFLEGVKVRRQAMPNIRKLTAKHMVESVKIAPHVTTTFEMDLHHIFEAKTKLADSFLKQHNSKLTFTAFFIEAAVKALKEFPEVNTSVDGDDLLFKEDINIGCAVAIDSGLIVPVLKNINDYSLFEIAKLLNDTVAKARDKKLNPTDVQGGTFSITNPGIYGSLHSQPIINQPQSAIMSTGAIIQRPVFHDGDIKVHPMVQVGLTFDHRVIDGEGGAKFLRYMKDFLESYHHN